MNSPCRHLLSLVLIALTLAGLNCEAALRDEAFATMKRAATWFHQNASAHGGYVYHVTTDLSVRWGEGKAAPTQIFVQPPATPTVGLAFLAAHRATGDAFYLKAARDAGEALVYGQLRSGGWTQTVDFEPGSPRTALYRNGKGKGRNVSSLDDGQTQSALRFLMHLDRALEFKHAGIHACATSALAAVPAAQHPNGAFPQGWEKPAPTYAPVKASYPVYDWRTEGRIKNYWDMPTLNDDACGYLSPMLIDAWNIYRDEAARKALLKLGDFLILAQMPEPQPGWAQQYNTRMQPIWARKFEPPALAGRETQDAIETLMKIHRFSGDAKYLEPVPRAIAWLKRSLLPDGRLARYYELKSNKPLYMTDDYKLTYSDKDVPDHYGWKTESRLGAIEAELARIRAKQPPPSVQSTEADVRRVVASLDNAGRWVSTYDGERLVGQPKFAKGAKYIASAAFAENVELLARYLQQTSVR